MFQFTISTMPEFANRAWVVYEVRREGKPQVQFVGISEFLNVAKVYQLISNPHFDKRQTWIISSVSYHNSKLAAYMAQGQHIQQLGSMPPLNRMLHMSRAGLVVCNETGEVFKNGSECAKAHNIAASRLSNHLNGRAGYRHIAGRTYRRATLASVGGVAALASGKIAT